MKWLLWIPVVFLLLSGCATENIRIIQSKEYILIGIDPSYLKDCEIVPPPARENYPKLSHDMKESLLTEVLIEQYGKTAKCTEDKRAIRELIVRQKQEIELSNQNEQNRVKKEGANHGNQ